MTHKDNTFFIVFIGKCHTFVQLIKNANKIQYKRQLYVCIIALLLFVGQFLWKA